MAVGCTRRSSIATFTILALLCTAAFMVPEAEAKSVPQRLAAFSSAAIDAMQGSLLRVRRYFAYASPSMAASRAPIIDAFTLGMLELWLKTRESPPEID